ncbi:MAG: 3-methyladenine DNA glycosylase, partial [Gemmatimonadales bacterium]|nr:3-methyladenine DNA glycosylase [Gemmatimonadales bacterium]
SRLRAPLARSCAGVLGCRLRSSADGQSGSEVIVEVEAYAGRNDPA